MIPYPKFQSEDSVNWLPTQKHYSFNSETWMHQFSSNVYRKLNFPHLKKVCLITIIENICLIIKLCGISINTTIINSYKKRAYTDV